MKYPLVSIIMTVYNKIKYVDLAIKSILNQSYPNIELIIIDDRSIDGSIDIISKYNSHSNIKMLFNDVNIGCYASRNKGLAIASGEYIGFQDADDYSLHNRIKKQIRFMMKNKLHFCGCNIVRSKYDTIPRFSDNVKLNDAKLVDQIIEDKSKMYFGYATLIISKYMINLCGYFNERRKGMDMEYGERLLFKGEKKIFNAGQDSWRFFNLDKTSKIYGKIDKLLYICPKINNNNITKAIPDDDYLIYRKWRNSYKN